jgi:amino acid adenylation domain-containing protein
MLLRAAERDRAQAAVVDGASTLDYGALASRSLAIASTLAGAGVRPGDRVALLLRRDADAAAAFYGALGAGGVAVIVNEQLRPRQIEHILDHSGASVLVSSADLLERQPRPLETAARTVDVATIESAGDLSPAPRAAGDVAQIVYTSGSTGLPKGVVLSHGGLWAGMEAVVDYLAIGSSDRIASLLPFSFDYGLNQLLCAVGAGATLVIERSPVAARIVQALREQRVTVVAGVPPLWLQLLDVAAFLDEPLPSLRLLTNSGGRLPTEAVRTLRSRQPQAEVVLMYGLTEAFRSSYLAAERVDRKPDSIGRAIPGAELLVLGRDLTPCAPGDVGELVHRGPTVALGYWNDPEATARVFRPNPLRPAGAREDERVVFSGDLVYRDDEGDLFFVGRDDAMIKTLGYRVSPDEVADVLYASGEIVEALVTSEPDERRGARVVAHVVMRAEGSLERLEEFARRELPRYMQPSRIEQHAELRRTPSGKHDLAAARAGR